MKNEFIVEMVSDIFDYRKEEVGELGSKRIHAIRFENRLLDRFSDFQTEINIYADDINRAIVLGLGNNLLLGIKISTYLNEEIIIGNLPNDQWFLIKGDHIFLVEEESQENYGINLMIKRSEISYKEALEMQSGEL
jgi:hypothetical protein